VSLTSLIIAACNALLNFRSEAFTASILSFSRSASKLPSNLPVLLFDVLDETADTANSTAPSSTRTERKRRFCDAIILPSGLESYEPESPYSHATAQRFLRYRVTVKPTHAKTPSVTESARSVEQSSSTFSLRSHSMRVSRGMSPKKSPLVSRRKFDTPYVPTLFQGSRHFAFPYATQYAGRAKTSRGKCG